MNKDGYTVVGDQYEYNGIFYPQSAITGDLSPLDKKGVEKVYGELKAKMQSGT